MAIVIILNGVSSAGKSTLARAIQQQAQTTFLHVEMDAFISFLPDGHEFRPEWFRVDEVESENGKVPYISNGPRGEALLSVMRSFVVEAARKGLDLIVDEVCLAKEIDEYRSGLAGCEAHVVKVCAPLDIVEAREKARGDRLIGLARGQAAKLHDGITYDMQIDTSTAPAEELAAQVLNAVPRG